MIQNAFEKKPALIFWELTQACDLVCKHCRASAKRFCDPHELTKVQGERLIDEIADWNGPMLILTGGDPLKHPNFWYWLDYARAQKVPVSVTPSPTPLVTDEAVRRMKNLGVNRLGLSLDGASPETHDRFRGVEGSFERVFEISQAAKQVDLSLQVNTTLTRHNIDELEQMAVWVKKMGAKMWSLFFLVPVGRGKNIELFTPEEHEDIFERLYWLKEKYDLPIKTTEAPHFRRFMAQHQRGTSNRGVGARDGSGIVFISRVGDIYPSGFLPLTAGNVKEDSLQLIYQKTPLFQALRRPSEFKGKCGCCDFRFLCGGSRARAYAMTGDPLESDPFCLYVSGNKLQDSSKK